MPEAQPSRHNEFPPSEWLTAPANKPELIGLVYLLAPPVTSASEVNLGVALRSDMQMKGYGPRVVMKALEMAFNTFGHHRVQVAIMDSPKAEHAIRMFIGM